jgi:choline dehydrogenase-like flavoprotein
MYVDARQIEDGSVIEGDICIIGAGAAGISMALEWMDTPYKVILLEGGGFQYEDRIQELFRGKTTGQHYYPLKSTRLHYFGGTTGHWGGMCSPFDPIVFQKRNWVNESGWPFTDKELLPYYKRANVNVDLGTYEFDLDYWLKQDPDFVTLPLGRDVFWNKIWRFSPPTRFGEKYKDTIVNAKNIHLYTYACAVNIGANENISRVKEVTIKNYAGKTHRVKAKYFVLACCAIENARLLLASNSQAPQGLGNDNDLVGRYFMEHAEIKSAELWLSRRTSFKLYLKSELGIRAELSMMAEKQAAFKVLNGILSFLPLERASKIPSYIEAWTSEDPRENEKKIADINDKLKDGKITRFENKVSRLLNSDKLDSFLVVMRLEQAPNPLSRVTLDTEKDELGVPRPMLNWAFTPLEKRTIRKIYQTLGQQVGAAGIGRIKLMEDIEDEKDDTMPVTTSAGWHHMGTTRMSGDARKGVVDANCKVHGISNLYVASSSCFPNGAGVNPTFTIVALSIRLADHLKGKMNS